MVNLSRDAEIVALCWFSIGDKMRIRFNRPHFIHPRMHAALNELTDKGILARTDDSRGPKEWAAVSDMSFARRFKQPTKSERFAMTVPEPDGADGGATNVGGEGK
jgi:hypothetical protein